VTPAWWREDYYVIESVRGVHEAETREPSMAHERS